VFRLVCKGFTGRSVVCCFAEIAAGRGVRALPTAWRVDVDARRIVHLSSTFDDSFIVA
jgi:hypothetical protein